MTEDKDATIARLSEQVNTLTTEKHADAEAIGALEAKLAEVTAERDLAVSNEVALAYALRSERAAARADAVAEEWREIEQAHQPRLDDGYTAVRISKPGFWLVKGPGPATAHAEGFAQGIEAAVQRLIDCGHYACADIISKLAPAPQADPVREAADVREVWRVIAGLAERAYLGGVTADRWLERMDEVMHDPSAASQYADYAIDLPPAFAALAQKGE